MGCRAWGQGINLSVDSRDWGNGNESQNYYEPLGPLKLGYADRFRVLGFEGF